MITWEWVYKIYCYTCSSFLVTPCSPNVYNRVIPTKRVQSCNSYKSWHIAAYFILTTIMRNSSSVDISLYFSDSSFHVMTANYKKRYVILFYIKDQHVVIHNIKYTIRVLLTTISLILKVFFVISIWTNVSHVDAALENRLLIQHDNTCLNW